MGRIKVGQNGAATWDPNDAGPDQVALSPVERQRLIDASSAPASGATASPAAPSGPTMADVGQSFGNPTLDNIAAIFRQYGVTPTYQLVSQWGTNVDQDYLRSIAQKIQEQYGPGGPQAQAASGTTAATVGGNAWDNPQNWGQAPPGFDPTKWSDPNYHSDKYTAGRIIAAGGSVDDVVKALPGTQKVGDDAIRGADGNVYDLIFDTEGLHRPQFTQVGGDSGSASNGASGGDWFDANGPGGGAAGTGDNLSTGYVTPGRPDYLRGAYELPQFKEPTYQDLLNSPGYQAAESAMQRGLERSAAAKGSILSGGFVGQALPRALGEFAQGSYANLYGNRLSAYGANTAANLSARNVNENAYQSDVGNSLNQYQQRYQAYRDSINDRFNLASLGLGATTAGRPSGG